MRMRDNLVSRRATFCEALFCLALVAVFLPVKIYPLVFLLALLGYFWDTPVLLRHYWVWSLGVFTGYASLVFLINLPEEGREATNFLKLPINFCYLYFAVGWLAQRDNTRLLRWVDVTLHLVLGLTLLQLLLYHQVAGFRWLGGAPSSAHGSALYQASHYFWGLDDKNMFGARIALLGFVYVLLPVVQKQKLVWWRIGLVWGLAWLSLSRTPMVALLLGIFCLLWAGTTVRWRVVLGALALLAIPFVAEKVVRVDTLMASNDGMGVRLVYWKAFFQHFTAISPLGNGFMSGGDFLGRYADFYHGEPHIHNTFFNCYLDFGIIGLASYALFLFYFYRFCMEKRKNHGFWWVAFLPLLAILMILYSGYDNDIVLYLILVFLLGSSYPVGVDRLRWRIGI
ncbi:O-Antigen ligase [Parapedobacter indicus]|uniref:O-Antigen ligase n=2 Tax=Parapedobacter indicus TaxID=1477437 RepID=A0A1I3EY56_9SPHI|nr:O-antigen ligase-like membrane protein [Parapedobacter indicus]SFI03894.1 O-Antigen ligase [Parapedobacter indicus]